MLVILGPTASGKSDLAVSLARKYGGEVVSADSRQVYKGLDIGTGKITKREMQGVPHHLLDVASPKRQFSAHDFVELAQKAIEDIHARGKLPIICGGTGFYISALLGETKLSDVPMNKNLRKELEKKSARELFEILQNLDAKRSKTIDKYNPHRLIRAIEIAKASAKHKQASSPKKQVPNKYEVCKIGVAPMKKISHPPTPSLTLRKGAKRESYIIDQTELKRKINERIDRWFKLGLINEVKNLHKKRISWKRMSDIGLEYRLVAQYLQKKLTKDQLTERMRLETWHYAKRQMTWFKRPVHHASRSDACGDRQIHWFKPDQVTKIQKLVSKFI